MGFEVGPKPNLELLDKTCLLRRFLRTGCQQTSTSHFAYMARSLLYKMQGAYLYRVVMRVVSHEHMFV